MITIIAEFMLAKLVFGQDSYLACYVLYLS